MQEIMAGGTLEPTNDMVQNACSHAAMDTFNNINIYSNPMARRGIRQMVDPKSNTVM